MRAHAVVLAVTLAVLPAAYGDRPMSGRQIHRDVSAKRALAPQSTAFGGYTPYHNGDTLRCSDCHVMHASEQHAWDGDTAGYPQSTPGYERLLRKSDPIDVCLACHDGMIGIPDVVGFDTNGLNERSAGFFDDPDTLNHRGHQLGRGLVADGNQFCSRCHFGGDFATAEVTCIDCHNPHGNDRVRNLQWPSAPGAEPQFGMLMRAGATGIDKYEASNVAFTYVAGTTREVTNMCIDCHHTFFDDSSHYYTNEDGDDHWNRHPNFNSEWGATEPIAAGADTGSSNPSHWAGGTGSGFIGAPRVRFLSIGGSTFDAATLVDPQTNAVFCLTCHKAHGSDTGFAIPWDPQTLPKPKGCDQCHGVMEP